MEGRDRDDREGPPDDRRSVEAVLAGAMAGDESAQTRLVGLLTPVIQTRVGRCLLSSGHAPSRQAVEDLTQDLFMKLFKNDWELLRDWDPERGLSLESFIGLVAHNHTRSVLRSRRRNPWTEQTGEDTELETPSAEADPERRHASQELLLSLLERFQRQLSERGWDVFELLFVYQYEDEEVGRIMNMNRDTVYQWRSRLRNKARQLASELDSVGARQP